MTQIQPEECLSYWGRWCRGVPLSSPCWHCLAMWLFPTAAPLVRDFPITKQQSWKSFGRRSSEFGNTGGGRVGGGGQGHSGREASFWLNDNSSWKDTVFATATLDRGHATSLSHLNVPSKFALSPPVAACLAVWIPGKILIQTKLANVKLNYSDRTASKICQRKQ